jgi:hypothetical protein
MSRIQVLYKAIAVLLQNNKTHCKGYKVHSRRRYLGGLTLFLKITCCSIRKTYSNDKVDNAKAYVIGTSKDGGTFFWEINTDLQVQKQKYPTIMKTKKEQSI